MTGIGVRVLHKLSHFKNMTLWECALLLFLFHRLGK